MGLKCLLLIQTTSSHSITTRIRIRKNCFSISNKLPKHGMCQSQRVNPSLCTWRKRIKIFPTQQPDRILVNETPRIRLVIPEEVVMQPGLFIEVLVLQAEGLGCVIRYSGFFFQTVLAGVVSEPQDVAVFIGHLTRDADLVAVEVVGLLSAFAVFGCPVVDLRQGVVAVGIGVDIGIPAVPNESGFLFEVV